jgi:hypothetical protein
MVSPPNPAYSHHIGINDQIEIADWALTESIARASGPGGHWLGNSGRFNQQIVKAAFTGQPLYFGHSIITQGAANAAVRHLDKCLVGSAGFSIGAHQIGVGVHFGHIVDDHGNTAAFTVAKYAIEQCRFVGRMCARQIKADH